VFHARGMGGGLVLTCANIGGGAPGIEGVKVLPTPARPNITALEQQGGLPMRLGLPWLACGYTFRACSGARNGTAMGQSMKLHDVTAPQAKGLTKVTEETRQRRAISDAEGGCQPGFVTRDKFPYPAGFSGQNGEPSYWHHESRLVVAECQPEYFRGMAQTFLDRLTLQDLFSTVGLYVTKREGAPLFEVLAEAAELALVLKIGDALLTRGIDYDRKKKNRKWMETIHEFAVRVEARSPDKALYDTAAKSIPSGSPDPHDGPWANPLIPDWEPGTK
jgi:hypothetical protein